MLSSSCFCVAKRSNRIHHGLYCRYVHGSCLLNTTHSQRENEKKRQKEAGKRTSQLTDSISRHKPRQRTSIVASAGRCTNRPARMPRVCSFIVSTEVVPWVLPAWPRATRAA